MRVVCVLPNLADRLESLAEACLIFTPQLAISEEALFLEIGASHRLFSETECLVCLAGILRLFGLEARLALASDLPTALAFARYGARARNELPIEALAEYRDPFAPTLSREAALFRRLGISTLGEFLALPRAEIVTRFGKGALLSLEHLSRASSLPWPRFVPEEKLVERSDFDCAAQIDNLEPVLFLAKNALDRLFARLRARRLKLVAFDLELRHDRLARAETRSRRVSFSFPVPQGDPGPVLRVVQERLHAELARVPLEDALEGLTLEVRETGPFLDVQKDFFAREREQQEALGSLMAQLRAKLGDGASFLARALPRRLPEASWEKCDREAPHTVIPMPLRPLRLLSNPLPLERDGAWLRGARRRWQVKNFRGPERVSGEWWLDYFQREYYRVETDKEELWVFRAPDGLFLHGIFD